MANQNSAKGNPASKRMTNPNNKAKRARNKSKNENLKAKNQHPKQLRSATNQMLHITKEHHGGLDRAERRYLEKYYPGELEMNSTGAISSDERRRRGENLRTVIKRDKRVKKKVKATQRSVEKAKNAFVSMGYAVEKANHQMSESFRVLEEVQLISLGVVPDGPIANEGFNLDDPRQ